MTTYLESLRNGLRESLLEDERVIVLGEDIIDPYGGAFKVTLGLSSDFPDRVISTPISEAGFTGAACGLAIRGLLPVVEIMFGDFLTLCADQIINHIAKFAAMYPGVTVPLVIRTPMGGGRGYGATHSQSLEKLFLGVPGLTVVSPSLAHDPGKVLKRGILADASPVLFIENKSLYGQDLCHGGNGDLTVHTVEDSAGYPVAVVRNMPDSPPDVLLMAYGGASSLVLSVMRKYVEEEISLKAIFPSRLQPIAIREILKESSENPLIIILEEGSASFNWGSEMAAILYENFRTSMRKPIIRLSAKDSIIPCAKDLEQDVLLNEDKLDKAIMELLS